MKLIVVVVRPDALEKIEAALEQPGVSMLAVTSVRDGRKKRHGFYRGAPYSIPEERLRLEIVVLNDRLVHFVVAALAEAASAGDTDRLDGGSICVLPLDDDGVWPLARTRNASSYESLTEGDVNLLRS
jgi:nitrogen regulatory protein PII